MIEQMKPSSSSRQCLASLPCFLLAILLLSSKTALAVSEEVPEREANDIAQPVGEFWNFPSCDLECANGGYCTLKRGSADSLAQEAQSGNLIEICVCRPGFTGVACENIVHDCELPERKCHNGAPCRAIEDQDDGTTTWECDCSIADSMSEFAGKMCRDPITEYCTGTYDPHSALSFCTNGGRCRADFLGASADPGNTTVNQQFQNAGCICPNDFYGPHCEFLRLNALDDPEKYTEYDDYSNGNGVDFSSFETKGAQEANNKYSSTEMAVLFSVLCLAVLGVLSLMIHVRRHNWVPANQIVLSHRDDHSVSTLGGNSHYLDNIEFIDEGIIVPHERLETVNENAVFT
mmetsp:Transcript_18999/g.30647  ORF Transcript_18999/g.30647 Transcript_18999/m.30647 type:complete len:347 (+) Transcript_18999:81-1121(+)